MFTRGLGATASYRTIARGNGRNWAHTLQACRSRGVEDRHDLSASRRPDVMLHPSEPWRHEPDMHEEG